MNWRIYIEDLFGKGDYLKVISELNKNIINDNEPFVSFMDLLYTYFYIIQYEHNPPYDDYDKWAEKLFDVYRKYSPRWTDCPDFLFFVAYMAEAFAEFYIGLDEKDTTRMYKKAHEMYPNNLLYQWGIYNSRLHSDDIQRMRLCKQLSIKLLNDDKCINQIMKCPLLGKDLFNYIKTLAIE